FGETQAGPAGRATRSPVAGVLEHPLERGIVAGIGRAPPTTEPRAPTLHVDLLAGRREAGHVTVRVVDACTDGQCRLARERQARLESAATQKAICPCARPELARPAHADPLPQCEQPACAAAIVPSRGECNDRCGHGLGTYDECCIPIAVFH